MKRNILVILLLVFVIALASCNNEVNVDSNKLLKSIFVETLKSDSNGKFLAKADRNLVRQSSTSIAKGDYLSYTLKEDYSYVDIALPNITITVKKDSIWKLEISDKSAPTPYKTSIDYTIVLTEGKKSSTYKITGNAIKDDMNYIMSQHLYVNNKEVTLDNDFLKQYLENELPKT